LKAHNGGGAGMPIAWSPDGGRLATRGFNVGEPVVIWDAITGKRIRTLGQPGGWPFGSQSIAWSPDGTRLALALGGGMIQIWDPATGKQTCNWKGHARLSSAVVWSPDGTHLASTAEDYTVRIWDATTGQEINAFVGHIRGAGSVAWHPDGKRLASGGLDLKIWDPITGKEAIDIKLDSRGVTSVAWSPDGLRSAASSILTPTVTIYDATKGYRLAGEAAPAAK